MKRLLISIILAVASLIPLSASKSLASIQPLMWNGKNHCTTFSINEEKGYWSTALHCVVGANGEQMMIGGESASPYMTNVTNDTAVLVSNSKAERLKLADHTPKLDEDIDVLGFPWGIEIIEAPFVRTHGKFVGTFKDEDGVWGMYDLSAAPGNSGSPVVSKRGVIGTLNFGFNDAGRLGGGTVWAALNALRDLGIWAK